MNRLVNLVEMAVGQGETFEEAIAYGVQAVLVSPHFLFRVEDDPIGEKGEATGPVEIADYELASRLSYFLWSSMPDAELFDLAAKGELSKPAVLTSQIKRMLDDEKSESLVANFFGQWLNLRNLDEVNPDSYWFPVVDDAAQDGDAEGDGAVLQGDHRRRPKHSRLPRRRLHVRQSAARGAVRDRVERTGSEGPVLRLQRQSQ